MNEEQVVKIICDFAKLGSTVKITESGIKITSNRKFTDYELDFIEYMSKIKIIRGSSNG